MPRRLVACPDCGKLRRARPGSRCHACASAAKTGNPVRTDGPEVRFWRLVDKTDSCWLWLGAQNGKGYGRFTLSGRNGWKRSAHRYAYELLVGPIAAGLDLDHLCRNRLCVNPEHLEPVTRRENLRRAGILDRRDALGQFGGAA